MTSSNNTEELFQAKRSFALSKQLTLARVIDSGFYWLTLISAIASAGVLFWIGYEVCISAYPAIKEYGLGFLVNTTWDPVENIYGVLPQITGTLLTALIGLLIAIPFGIGIAIFLSEDFFPKFISVPISMAIELIAAIPSVVLGLWGIFVFIPFITPFYEFVHQYLGDFFLFSGSPRGYNPLTVGIVLALMITPIIASLSRETLLSLPPDLREASMSLGATRWETILGVLIPAGFSGIVGSIMLALGRAMGETMVATMLIGNANRLPESLFSPASTIASLIASQFGEAGGKQVAALLYAGLVLMVLTFLVNLVAELIIKRFQNVE